MVGDAELAEDSVEQTRLIELLYDELHGLAARVMKREREGHTLQPTALVHEAYLRLLPQKAWENKAHFYGAAARAMRNVLVDHARRRGAGKRGGGARRLELIDQVATEGVPLTDVLDLDDALKQLEAVDAQASTVVMFRCYLGLSVQETADAMQMSKQKAERQWRFARAFLHRALSGENLSEGPK